MGMLGGAPRAGIGIVTRWSCISFVFLSWVGLSLQAQGELLCPENFYPKKDLDEMQNNYKRDAFMVEAGDNKTFRGNASLISSDGYFLTAAHVISELPKSTRLWLSRRDSESGPTKTYTAEVVYAGDRGSSPKDVANDIALLKAKDWNSVIDPVELRYSGGHFDSGYFIAFPDARSAPTIVKVEVGNTDPTASRGPLLGQVDYGMSGSLLVDAFGFAEGVVAAFNNSAEDELNGKGILDKTREYMLKRQQFGAAVIMPEATWLAKLPIDRRIQNIADHCSKNSANRDDLELLKQYKTLPLSAIDRIYSRCLKAKFVDSHVGEAFREFISDHLLVLCADETHRLRLFEQSSADEQFQRGHAALKRYADEATYSDPREKVRYDSLLTSYALLTDAAAKGKPNPQLYPDLARAEFELALANGLPLDPRSQIAASIIENLRKASASGADPSQIRDVAFHLATTQKDWDTAAALVAYQARDLASQGKLKNAGAIELQKEISQYAGEKAALAPDTDWVHQWNRIAASDETPRNRVIEFNAFAPPEAKAYDYIAQ